MKSRKCFGSGCHRVGSKSSRGFCVIHYYEARNAGEFVPKYTIDPMERFFRKVEVQEDTGCWYWRGSKNKAGYGSFLETDHRMTAHRWIYLRLAGDIPPNYQLDHLCGNTSCVNPGHVEPVTCQVNLLRGDTVSAANSRKTHCPKGHALSGDNLRMDWARNGRVCRRCIRCRKEQVRLRKEKHRLLVKPVVSSGN
jgi:hypothetical protein